MQKLTIFFIGATVIIVLIVGTGLGYKFFERRQSQSDETETTQEADSIQEEEFNTVVSEKSEIEDRKPIISEPEINGETDTAIVIESNNTAAFASITEESLEEAGFGSPELQISPFNGMVFDIIDLKEYRDDDHIHYQLLNNTEYAGTVSELIFPTDEISTEFYSTVRTRIDESPSFEINETNQYGDKSFFSNHATENNIVFLVVKINQRLYTLHYPAKNHNKIKNLINLL